MKTKTLRSLARFGALTALTLTLCILAFPQRRLDPATFTALQKREVASAVKLLVSDLNGTWELAERSVTSTATKGKLLRVDAEGTMVFNLKSNGLRASGDFIALEEGLGNQVVSDDLANGEAFSIGSYNNAGFEGHIESGPVASGDANHSAQELTIVISETLSGEILGSYGTFRSLTKFSDPSDKLPVYRLLKSGSRTFNARRNIFVSKGEVPVPNGNNNKNVAGSDTDNWDVVELTANSMILTIPARGIRDVWVKVSSNVTMRGQPLNRYWENMKSSGQLLKPSFKAVGQ